MSFFCSVSSSSASPTILVATADGQVGDGARGTSVDGLALVLDGRMGLGDNLLGLLVSSLDDTGALGLGVLTGLENDVGSLTTGVGDDRVGLQRAWR